MAHPQSSNRGYKAGKRRDIGLQQLTDGTTYLALNLGLSLSAQTAAITQNANDVVLPGGVKVSNARSIRGNSTAYLFEAETGLPATDGGTHKWTFVISAGGTGALAINTTGTTWKYVRMTSNINST